MHIKGWDCLDGYFNSGEWQVVNEKLKDLERVNRPAGYDGYNPGRESLFRALRLVSYREVSVAIIGQDPYPERRFSTGIAFSIPSEIKSEEYPPTLKTILAEYGRDLHLPSPSNGDLSRWSEEGHVLLWNSYPSCASGHSLSHDWPEWELLTSTIVQELSKKGIVFALLGSVARRYLPLIDLRNNSVVVTSHPSPRGSLNSKTPFVGSRIFTTINDKLVNNGQSPIDWSLP